MLDRTPRVTHDRTDLTAAANRPTPCARRVRHGRAHLWLIGLVLAMVSSLAATTSGPAAAQDGGRVGTNADPVLRAIEIEQARLEAHGRVDRIVVGRADVFVDSLAATALAGADGALLLVDGGPDASLRPEVAEQVTASLSGGECLSDAPGPAVFVVGGEQAVSAQIEQFLTESNPRACVRRLAGDGRTQTAIEIAGALDDPSSTVVLTRSDDWADAGAVGAWAAATRSRILVTRTSALESATADALRSFEPDRIVLIGGPLALSADVEASAAEIADVVRIAGDARDETAVAIAEQLWASPAGRRYLADGYAEDDWTSLFVGAPLAAADRAPILYSSGDAPTGATQAHLDRLEDVDIVALGPDDRRAPADLLGADVAVESFGTFSAPLMAKVRPGTREVWVAERAGRIVAVNEDDGERRTVLDISGRVSTNGERGLLGIAFDDDGNRVFTSHTDNAGSSVIDAFAIVDGSVDSSSAARLMTVQQPASNHNGGDLQWGPDDVLWWGLGDGGGANDRYATSQDPMALLGSMLRVNPADGAFERWGLGLRNPFRFDFDDQTGDLYIADVGQNEIEEIDFVPAGSPSGQNFGWSYYEGSRRFNDPYNDTPPADLVFPVWEETHGAGNCSITGGVVYRGDAIPDLHGAYLYSDLCNTTIRAILVEDGRVTQNATLGIRVSSPVGFSTDADGEVLVMSLGGTIHRIVPGT